MTLLLENEKLELNSFHRLASHGMLLDETSELILKAIAKSTLALDAVSVVKLILTMATATRLSETVLFMALDRLESLMNGASDAITQSVARGAIVQIVGSELVEHSREPSIVGNELYLLRSEMAQQAGLSA